MRLVPSPQTGIRQVSKHFRLLYPLVDQLNENIKKYVEAPNKIKTVQVLFDTDIIDDNYVKLLSLRDNILQIETSLNWEGFSKLERKDQDLIFIKKLHRVSLEIANKYKLDVTQIEIAFRKLMNEIAHER